MYVYMCINIHACPYVKMVVIMVENVQIIYKGTHTVREKNHKCIHAWISTCMCIHTQIHARIHTHISYMREFKLNALNAQHQPRSATHSVHTSKHMLIHTYTAENQRQGQPLHGNAAYTSPKSGPPANWSNIKNNVIEPLREERESEGDEEREAQEEKTLLSRLVMEWIVQVCVFVCEPS